LVPQIRAGNAIGYAIPNEKRDGGKPGEHREGVTELTGAKSLKRVKDRSGVHNLGTNSLALSCRGGKSGREGTCSETLWKKGGNK